MNILELQKELKKQIKELDDELNEYLNPLGFKAISRELLGEGLKYDIQSIDTLETVASFENFRTILQKSNFKEEYYFHCADIMSKFADK